MLCISTSFRVLAAPESWSKHIRALVTILRYQMHTYVLHVPSRIQTWVQAGLLSLKITKLLL